MQNDVDNVFVLKKIKEGDLKLFEQLFKCYYSPLCLYAFSITARRDISEEIVQELFYKLWKERENLQIFRSVKAYLYGAVRNQSLRYCEYHRVRECYLALEGTSSGKQILEISPLEQLEYKELEEIIGRTLERLPGRCAQIFRMHRFQGCKYKEIADRLSLSVKTVEAEMTKAYKRLRKEIEYYATK